jgi:hypothetical protein
MQQVETVEQTVEAAQEVVAKPETEQRKPRRPRGSRGGARHRQRRENRAAASGKTLHNSTVSGARVNVKDLVVFGDGDTFKLICKASSAKEGWMKSTKAMEIAGVGVVLQVTTQQGDNVAEALQLIPGAVVIPIDGNKENGRKIVAIDSAEHKDHLARVAAEQAANAHGGLSLVRRPTPVNAFKYDGTPESAGAIVTWAQALLGNGNTPITYTAEGLIVSTSNGEVPANAGDYVLYNGFDFYPATEEVVAASYYL